jgi:solute:Na+ symporter, SSS family
MQTCSAALNSAATLCAYDIFKRWKPATPDHQLVVIGKITTVLGAIFAIATSPIFGKYTTIFEGISRMICYVAPPITAVFLFGVFSRRASGRAAYLTLVAGALLGVLIFCLDLWKMEIGGWLPEHAAGLAGLFAAVKRAVLTDFMLTSFYMLVVCCGLMWAGSRLMPEPLKPEARLLIWEDWTEPLRAKCGSGLSDYRVMSAVVLLTFVVLYIIFR